MIGRIVWRIASRTIGFAVAGALMMAVLGLAEGAIMGVLTGPFLPWPGTAMMTPSGVIIVHTQIADSGSAGAGIGVRLGAAVAAFAFAVVGAATSLSNNWKIALGYAARYVIWGSVIGVVFGAMAGIGAPSLAVWTADNWPSMPGASWVVSLSQRGIAGYRLSVAGYIFGVIGGFIIGTFAGALCSVWGRSLPRNGREFMQSVKRLGGLGKAS